MTMVQSAFPRPTDFSEEVSGLMYGYYFSAGDESELKWLLLWTSLKRSVDTALHEIAEDVLIEGKSIQ